MKESNLKFSELDLNNRLTKSLEKLELKTCTPVQTLMLPEAFAGKDVLASAETGSGKTFAYLLPMLQKFLVNPNIDSETRALVLVPTRELAEQVVSDCNELSQFTQIKCLGLIGGQSFKEQKALIRKNPEILVATPGRLLEHLEKKSVDFSELEILVLDEADRMLDMGFREDVLKICEACEESRQTFLLSATLQHKGIDKIAKAILNDPVHLDTGAYRKQDVRITQQLVLADEVEHKNLLVVKLLENVWYKKVLIFTNTKVQAAKLDSYLQYKKYKSASLHGDLTQDERQVVMSRFRQGHITVLVATDLAARGLDIGGIDLVVNYNMARSGDDYIHRIGRTGRAGESGTAVSLINSNDWNLTQSIARYLNLEFETVVLKGLEAKFKGRVVSRGSKSDKLKKVKSKKKGVPKAKQRHRNKKNIGKRKSSANTRNVNQTETSIVIDGLEPLKKKS